MYGDSRSSVVTSGGVLRCDDLPNGDCTSYAEKQAEQREGAVSSAPQNPSLRPQKCHQITHHCMKHELKLIMERRDLLVSTWQTSEGRAEV